MKGHAAAIDKTSDDRPCVFICIRDFSSVRNILPPDSVAEMARSDIRFVFLVPDPENAFIRSYLSAPGFAFEKLEIDTVARSIRKGRLLEWLRQVRFLTYGNSTPRSMGTRLYHVLVFKREMLGSAGTLFGKLYYGTVVPMAHMAGRMRILRTLIVALEKRLLPHGIHRRLYEKYNPAWLVVPTLGYAHDTLLMHEAQHYGCKVLSVVRSWDNTTNKGYGGARADHVFAWNETMAAEIHRYHDIPEPDIEVTGIPHWDAYFQNTPMRTRTQFFADHGLNPDRKTIYYAMSGPNSFRRNLDIIRLLLEALRDGSIEEPAQLLVRIHPSYVLNTDKWTAEIEELEAALPELKREFGDLLGVSEQDIDEIGGMRLLTHRNQILHKEIFSHTDILVNIYSTQMIEGAIFDVPVITAGWHPLRDTDEPISVFEKYDHVRRVLMTNAVTTTHSPGELVDSINIDLQRRDRLHEERRTLVDQEITHFRGTAGVRIAQRIVALARSDQFEKACPSSLPQSRN